MSNAERQKRYKKRNVTEVDENVTGVTPFHRASVTDVAVPASVTHQQTVTRTASLDDYNASRQDYANRTKPEMLNWGLWMSSDELSRAGLKANRVAVEGDWDYAGVVFKPECVTCDDLEPDEKGRACCAVGGDCTGPAPVHEQARQERNQL